MSKAKFTERYIRDLPVKAKAYNRTENSLRIRVYPTGTKSWSFYGTDLNGLRTPQKLGTYPEVSLAKARKMATVQASNIYTTGHGITTNAKGITYKDFIQSAKYQSTGKLRPSHDRIMKNLTSEVTGLPDVIQNLPIKAINQTHIENYIDKRLKKDLCKKGTLNKNLANIRSVFRVAFDKGVIAENIMSKVKQLKDDTATEKLALTKDERKRLLRYAGDMKQPQAYTRKHMAIYVILGLDTGLRKSELLSLRWGDFHNDNMITEDVIIQGVKFNYQTYKVVVAEHMKDGDALTEKQIINNYDATKRMLTYFRFYPSFDAEYKDEHKDVEKLGKALHKNGYKLKIDDSRSWYVTVPADKAKNREARSVGVRHETMKKLSYYLKKEVHEPPFDKLLTIKKQKYRYFGYDDNLNVLYNEDKDLREGNVKGYTDIGYMQDKLLFPRNKLSTSIKDKKSTEPISDVKISFTTIRKLAGLSKLITPHTLRHEFCTDLIRHGIAISEVQRLAGHKDIKTTMRYVHALESKDFSALDKADKNRES